MPRRTNQLKWKANLLKLGETIHPDTDRVVMGYPFVREIKYRNLGVSSTDKIFADRDVNEVVKKIEVRLDRAIEDNQKDYRIEIRGKKYNIERIYTKEDERLMELSLSYAD
ncbi:head-tail adaptor protein [Cytobacillus firmus]|uniref:head-tail adaptor protein n=1 Tax=Cytobacillus firmus TaxID=1399 RepID=UPI00207AB484|nr:head-tail adaptor protein [Cytobacillus firmus]USK40170.1 head-tail adaptor protein [Cytobacillus firmus]